MSERNYFRDPSRLKRDVDLIGFVVTHFLRGLSTVFVARIVDFDRATRKATIRPIIRSWFGKTVDGEFKRVWERDPLIAGVPVAWFGGAGRGMATDLQVGDTVLCASAKSFIADWLASDESDVTPGIGRNHDVNDAVVLAQLNAFARPLQGLKAGLVIGDLPDSVSDEARAGGNKTMAQFHVDDGGISIGIEGTPGLDGWPLTAVGRRRVGVERDGAIHIGDDAGDLLDILIRLLGAIGTKNPEATPYVVELQRLRGL